MGEGIDAALDQLGDPLEVAGRLRHLAAGHEEVLAVDPQRGGDLAGQCRALGDLVLVVGEDVVDAAGVDVEARPEVAECHRRALDVPAGEALAPPSRRPAQQATLAGGLPEREVRGVALVGLDLAAMAGSQLVERVARQPAVAVECGDRVVDVARIGRVGKPGVHEPLDQGDHLGDVLGGARVDVRRQDVDGGFVGVERRFVGVGDLGRRAVLETRLDEHRIVAPIEALVPEMADVGHVLDVTDLEAVVERGPAG